MRSILWVLGACAACGGRPYVAGDVSVDGAPTIVETCLAGPTLGFFGVELVARGGQRIRLVYDPRGEAIAYLFRPGRDVVELGRCGPMDLVNVHLAHAHGTAALACTREGHTLEARRLTFRDCEYVR